MSRVIPFAVGAGLLVGSGILASRSKISGVEEDAFHAINRMPSHPAPAIKVVMQLGTFGTVPAVSALALANKQRELAARIALAGTAAWLGSKAIKRMVGRGRPAALHSVGEMRGSHGGDFGWISGHTAVATTMAVVAMPHLPRWAKPLLLPLAAAVGFARIYVGAHEPLDVVGGAGFGLILGSVFRK